MGLGVDWCSFVQFCLYTYYGQVLHNCVGILCSHSTLVHLVWSCSILFGRSKSVHLVWPCFLCWYFILVRLVQPCSMYAGILFDRSMAMFFVR